MTIEFDEEFALHPVRETASVSNAGASAERRIESRYDIRHGKRIEIGRASRSRGRGRRRERLRWARATRSASSRRGRPAAISSGFGASVEYRYVFGDPTAADPIARLSSVEIRRREPEAPQGYLTTRSYWDALGRERITTNEQNVVDPPLPGGRPSLETVVVRHLDYGPNGRLVRSFAPYVANPSSLALEPPSQTAATSTSYVLNGNAAGRLDPAGRVFETTGFDGSRLRTYYLGRMLRRVDRCRGGSDVGQSHARDPRRARAGRRAPFAPWLDPFARAVERRVRRPRRDRLRVVRWVLPRRGSSGATTCSVARSRPTTRTRGAGASATTRPAMKSSATIPRRTRASSPATTA